MNRKGLHFVSSFQTLDCIQRMQLARDNWLVILKSGSSGLWTAQGNGSISLNTALNWMCITLTVRRKDTFSWKRQREKKKRKRKSRFCTFLGHQSFLRTWRRANVPDALEVDVLLHSDEVGRKLPHVFTVINDAHHRVPTGEKIPGRPVKDSELVDIKKTKKKHSRTMHSARRDAGGLFLKSTFTVSLSKKNNWTDVLWMGCRLPPFVTFCLVKQLNEHQGLLPFSLSLNYFCIRIQLASNVYLAGTDCNAQYKKKICYALITEHLRPSYVSTNN